MRLLGSSLALCVLALTHASQIPAQGRHGAPSSFSGRVRVYYIAADELDWTYIPSRGDQAITGKKDDFEKDPAAKGTLDPNATTYRKALYREYTDSSFRTLKPRTDAWMHLGVMGPVIRGEVGDTIKVVFRNHATRPFSVHPHGVFYKKDAEGLAYLDGTSGADRKDDSVATGATHTYVWFVPERAGPAHGEGSSVFWTYHSHVDEGKDINAGLIGPMIITRKGMARPDGSPKDVDREFVAQYALYDEPDSWFWDVNAARAYGSVAKFDSANKSSNNLVRDFHHFFTINGFSEGNGPMFRMKEGERVRWYVFTNPNELNAWDIHTPHWHGQTAVVAHMRTDMIMLTPMMSAIADMVPDNPGTWLFHCHMPGHFGGGMYSRFIVAPR
ncbi:MAG: multicopper oxidase domain-containing protein [bacterium]